MTERNKGLLTPSQEITESDAKYLAGVIAGVTISSALLSFGNEEAKIVGAVISLVTVTSPVALAMYRARPRAGGNDKPDIT